MKHLVVYICENGKIGNVDCNFQNSPPTIQNIHDAEKKISDKYCHAQKITIVNWLEISE